MRREAAVLQTQTLILLHAMNSTLNSRLTAAHLIIGRKLYGAVVYHGADRSDSKQLKN